MSDEPSTHEQSGVSFMEHLRAAELIQQLKETKERNEITYPRIMDRIEKNGKFVSLTTLRRVFAAGSEENAASFSYENTLLPIAEALLDVEDVPTPPDSPYSKEKEHLESRITFLLEQIEKKDRRMDEKDEIIRRLMGKIL